MIWKICGRCLPLSPMRISLVAVGTRMPGWVEQGVAQYSKRLPRELKWEVREVPLSARGKSTDLVRAVEQEGERMLAAVPASDRIVALDVEGSAWNTEELTVRLGDWMRSGHDLSLLVGGPDGLAPGALVRAQQRWSLSPLTLPHPLVRIVVAEQLYRAWSILQNHPYHR